MLDRFELILDHEFFPLLIVIVVVAWIIIAYSKATKKDRLEEQLATSKISSISVGLVEVVGHVRMITQCESPVFEKTCVGFSYNIQRISRDSDNGRNSYHTKYTENHIEPFFIEDDTGKILVEPAGLQADSLPEDFKYKTNYRFNCAHIKDGDKVMIIASAQPRDGELILQSDKQNDIFTLTPFSTVVHNRAIKPLMTRAFLYLLIAAVVTSLIIYF